MERDLASMVFGLVPKGNASASIPPKLPVYQTARQVDSSRRQHSGQATNDSRPLILLGGDDGNEASFLATLSDAVHSSRAATSQLVESLKKAIDRDDMTAGGNRRESIAKESAGSRTAAADVHIRPALGAWWEDIVSAPGGRQHGAGTARKPAPIGGSGASMLAEGGLPPVQSPAVKPAASAPPGQKVAVKFKLLRFGSGGTCATVDGAEGGVGEGQGDAVAPAAAPPRAPGMDLGVFGGGDEDKEGGGPLHGVGGSHGHRFVLKGGAGVGGAGDVRHAVGDIPADPLSHPSSAQLRYWGEGEGGGRAMERTHRVAAMGGEGVGGGEAVRDGLTGTLLEQLAPPLTSSRARSVLHHPGTALAVRRARRREAVGRGGAGSTAMDYTPFVQPSLWHSTWQSRVVTSPCALLALALDRALRLGLLAPAPTVAPAPDHAKPVHARGGAGGPDKPCAPPHDLSVQALFGVGVGSVEEVLAHRFGAGAGEGVGKGKGKGKGGAHTTTAAADGSLPPAMSAPARLHRPSDLSDLPPLPCGVELSLRLHHHGASHFLHAGGGLRHAKTGAAPPPSHTPSLPLHVPIPLCCAEGAPGQARREAKEGGDKGAGMGGAQGRGRLPGPVSTQARGHMAVKVSTAIRGAGAGVSTVGGGRTDPWLASYGSTMHMFEYAEPYPLFIPPVGMTGRLVTFYRARSDGEVREGVAGGEEEGGQEGGGAGVMVRTAAGAPKPSPGAVLEVLRPRDPSPLLGGIGLGESITCLVTPLFIAPVVLHPAHGRGRQEDGEDEEGEEDDRPAPTSHTDFLLIAHTQASEGEGEEDGVSVQGGARRLKMYIREITSWWSVGQQQARVPVLPPPTRGNKGMQFFDPGLQAFLRAYACWHVLAYMCAEDEEYERGLILEGKLPPAYTGQAGAPRVSPGTVSARSARAHFLYGVATRPVDPHYRGMEIDTEAYLRLVEPVALYSPATHTLARRQGKTPADARVEFGLTLDRLAGYEAMRAWADILPQFGVGILRNDDAGLAEALRTLQTIHDRSVEKLQAGLSHPVAEEGRGASKGGPREAWEVDGGYTRFQKVLRIAQALHNALASCPWHTSANLARYTAGEDNAAVALADPVGAGDPSSRGEFFTWMREMNARGLNAVIRSRLAAKTSRREGTDKDLRALTMSQLASILLDYGRTVEEIRPQGRWDRVAAIREIQNNEAVRGAGGEAGSLLFVGETKITARDKRKLKDEQAKEILGRQLVALSRPHALGMLGVQLPGVGTRTGAARPVSAPAPTPSPSHAETVADGAGGEVGGEGEAGLGFGEEELAAELERRFEGKAGVGGGALGAGAGGGGRLTAKEAAAAAERVEFDAFKAALRGGKAWEGGWREKETAERAQAQAKVVPLDPLAILRARYPHIPDALLVKGPDDVPLVVGGVPPGMSAAMYAARPSRAGSRNAEPITALGGLYWGDRAPVFTRDTASGAVTARGKVLRTVRTSVDENGVQSVWVTYSTNPYAMKQAWVKRAKGIDLGGLGPEKGIDPTHRGLVATGLYRPPTDRATLRRPGLRDDILNFRSGYTDLSKAGIIPKGKALRVLPRVLINGTTVGVCKVCMVWGHRRAVCPFHSDVQKEPGALIEDKSIEGAVASARAAKIAGITGKVTFKAGMSMGVMDGRKRKLEDEAEAAGAPGPVHAAAGAGVSGVGVVRRQMAGDVPPTRSWVTAIESRLTEEGNLDVYAFLWDMSEHPAAASQPPRYRFDLRTLRCNLIHRLYTSWSDVNAELHRLHDTARALYGETRMQAKAAGRFCRAMREWANRLLTALKRDSHAIEQAASSVVLNRVEVLAEEVLKAGYVPVPRAGAGAGDMSQSQPEGGPMDTALPSAVHTRTTATAPLDMAEDSDEEVELGGGTG